MAHTHTDKHRKKAEDANAPTLNRTESIWVANWLRENNKELPNGWISVYQMTAQRVADIYGVPVEDVQAAANGEKR